MIQLEVGKIYFIPDPVPGGTWHFVGEYKGKNDEGVDVFTNSEGLPMDWYEGLECTEATPEQIEDYY